MQLFDTSLQVEVAPPPAKRLPAVVPGPPPVHALARFDDDGAEYLNFVAGDLIMIRAPPPGVDAAGWAYGFLPRTGRCLFSARARGVRARPQRSGQEEMTATRGHWLVSADVRALGRSEEAGLSRGRPLAWSFSPCSGSPKKNVKIASMLCRHPTCAVFPGQTNETGPGSATPQIGGVSGPKAQM